ncbi:MAG: hypothetical protein MdMp014T_1364 [Treponematales bacterium]
MMAKGSASPTSSGSLSPEKTSLPPGPVSASDTAFTASLFIEHEHTSAAHTAAAYSNFMVTTIPASAAGRKGPAGRVYAPGAGRGERGPRPREHATRSLPLPARYRRSPSAAVIAAANAGSAMSAAPLPRGAFGETALAA